jgi:hypothetical protein
MDGLGPLKIESLHSVKDYAVKAESTGHFRDTKEPRMK